MSKRLLLRNKIIRTYDEDIWGIFYKKQLKRDLFFKKLFYFFFLEKFFLKLKTQYKMRTYYFFFLKKCVHYLYFFNFNKHKPRWLYKRKLYKKKKYFFFKNKKRRKKLYKFFFRNFLNRKSIWNLKKFHRRLICKQPKKIIKFFIKKKIFNPFFKFYKLNFIYFRYYKWYLPKFNKKYKNNKFFKKSLLFSKYILKVFYISFYKKITNKSFFFIKRNKLKILLNIYIYFIYTNFCNKNLKFNKSKRIKFKNVFLKFNLYKYNIYLFFFVKKKISLLYEYFKSKKIFKKYVKKYINLFNNNFYLILNYYFNSFNFFKLKKKYKFLNIFNFYLLKHPLYIKYLQNINNIFYYKQYFNFLKKNNLYLNNKFNNFFFFKKKYNKQINIYQNVNKFFILFLFFKKCKLFILNSFLKKQINNLLKIKVFLFEKIKNNFKFLFFNIRKKIKKFIIWKYKKKVLINYFYFFKSNFLYKKNYIRLLLLNDNNFINNFFYNYNILNFFFNNINIYFDNFKFLSFNKINKKFFFLFLFKNKFFIYFIKNIIYIYSCLHNNTFNLEKKKNFLFILLKNKNLKFNKFYLFKNKLFLNNFFFYFSFFYFYFFFKKIYFNYFYYIKFILFNFIEYSKWSFRIFKYFFFYNNNIFKKKNLYFKKKLNNYLLISKKKKTLLKLKLLKLQKKYQKALEFFFNHITHNISWIRRIVRRMRYKVRSFYYHKYNNFEDKDSIFAGSKFDFKSIDLSFIKTDKDKQNNIVLLNYLKYLDSPNCKINIKSRNFKINKIITFPLNINFNKTEYLLSFFASNNLYKFFKKLKIFYLKKVILINNCYKNKNNKILFLNRKNIINWYSFYINNVIDKIVKSRRFYSVKKRKTSLQRMFTLNLMPVEKYVKKRKTSSSFFKYKMLKVWKFRKFYGCLTNYEFKRLCYKAYKYHGDVLIRFIILLESRIDTLLYRTGLVSSIFEARQLINHKNILINNNIVDKRSVTLNYHDILTIDYKVVNKLINNLIFRINTEGILFRPPVYIEVNYKKYMVIFLFDIIKANQIPFNFKITGLDINTILYYYY